MKRTYFWGACIIALLIVYLLVEADRTENREVEWEENYYSNGKQPYDTYLLLQALPHLFPEGQVTRSNQRIRKEWQHPRYQREAWLFINRSFQMTTEELPLLLDYVNHGNIVFISAYNMPDTLLSLFHLKENWGYGSLLLKSNPGKKYTISYYAETLTTEEGFQGDVLGTLDSYDRDPYFVRVPYGEGEFYFHSAPKVFTNYHLLDTLTGDHYTHALSYLPPELNIVWDDYQKSKHGFRMDGDTPLRVVLQEPALKIGYYLLLLVGLFYLLFRSKREQRVIPIIRSPKNKTLEFVAVVSSLYYKNKSHTNIARRRIAVFLQEVRYFYKLNTERLDERFIEQLTERSGVEKGETEALINFILQLQKQPEISEIQLKKLMNYLVPFKQKRYRHG